MVLILIEEIYQAVDFTVLKAESGISSKGSAVAVSVGSSGGIKMGAGMNSSWKSSLHSSLDPAAAGHSWPTLIDGLPRRQQHLHQQQHDA